MCRAPYVTPCGRFYVSYVSLNGTWDVCSWPDQQVVANRDSKSAAIQRAKGLAMTRNATTARQALASEYTR